MGLFGATGDITQTEFEIVRDCIEVLTFVTPSLTIEPAQNESEANFAVYIANDPDNSPDPNIFPYVVCSSPSNNSLMSSNITLEHRYYAFKGTAASGEVRTVRVFFGVHHSHEKKNTTTYTHTHTRNRINTTAQQLCG